MMELKDEYYDEYIRNFAFEPEFLTRKDSIDMHRDRIKREQKHTKKLAKTHSVDLQTLSEEEIASKFKENVIDAEVYSFCTVIITMNHALSLEIGKEHLRDI
jgi:hypothetical protein